MYDIHVTRNHHGSNNTNDTETLSDQPVEDRTKVHEYKNDFDEFNIANYTVTGAAFTPIAGDGGLIQAVGGSVLQAGRGTYRLSTDFRTFASFLFSLDIPTSIIVGLINPTAIPFTGGTITDGFYLASSGTFLEVHAVANGIDVHKSKVATLNPGTSNFISFKVYWDGSIYVAAPGGRLVYEVSGNGVVAAVRSSFGGSSAIPLPRGFPTQTLLCPTFAFSGAVTMTLDFFSIIKERISPLMQYESILPPVMPVYRLLAITADGGGMPVTAAITADGGGLPSGVSSTADGGGVYLS